MQERDLNYWVGLIRRRKAVILEVGVAVFALIAIATLVWPPVYQSTAKILVQDNRAQYLISPQIQGSSADRPAVLPNPVTEEDLNSELEILTSLYLINQTIAGLREPSRLSVQAPGPFAMFSGAAELATLGYHALHGTPNLTPKDQWALELEQHLSSSVIKRSDVIEVSFNSHDPRWSRDFLSRLINQYLEYRARISNDPQAQQFFRQQAQLLQSKLYASQNNLRDFQMKTGITSLPDQTQALVKRLSDLNVDYERAGAELASAEQGSASLQAQLSRTPERIGKEVRSVQNLALQQLKPQVAQLEAERAELLNRYQPTSRRIGEIDAKLAAAQRILSREDHLEVQERSTDLNPVWVTVDSDLARAKTNSAALKARRDALAKEIEQVRGELTQMANNGLEFQRLQQQVQNDKESYVSYLRKTEEARAAEALNRNKILNVSIAQAPNLPLRPVFPRVQLNLLAALFLAAVLGLGAGYWEEWHDQKIYSAAAIAEASGLNTIAVLRDEA
jgi:uncharacterized protein involved in exopolysaccharide biosynthesis